MRRFGFVLLFAFLPLTASAWTRASDERIAMKAAALAPPDLRVVIGRFEHEYKAGVERARLDEGSDAHYYFVASRQGRLRDRIERESLAVAQLIRKGEPMPSVIERLGVIAHLVADANSPFHAANEDARMKSLQRDYEEFFERKMTKFPTVFYGLDPQMRIASRLDRTFARSARFYPLLREEYFRHGARRTSSEFDERSTAFGVASISYSRAVSDLVNVYYFIWKEAGGDVRSAPSMRKGNLYLNAN